MTHEVSLPEAAAMIERGQTTIREWLQEGLLRARKDARGRWLIERDSLLARAAVEGTYGGRQRAGAAGASSVRSRTSHAEPTSDGTELIATLRTENDYLKQLLREERERCRRLEEERTQHLAEMRALLSKDSGGKDGVLSRWIRR